MSYSLGDMDEELRSRFLIVVGIASVFTTLGAFSGLTSEVGYWMFGAALCWSIGLQIVVSHLDKLKKTKTFYYILLSKAREFAFITTLVLAAYSAGGLWITVFWCLDSKTLMELSAWNARVESTHEALKVFLKWQLLATSAVFLVLRFIEFRYFGTDKRAKAVYVRLKVGFRWLERVSLALMIAASLTFLGTRAEGPVTKRILVQTRNLKKEYMTFQREVEKKVAAEVRAELLVRAWCKRSSELKITMRWSARMIFLREQLERQQKHAEHSATATFSDLLPGIPEAETPRSVSLKSLADLSKEARQTPERRLFQQEHVKEDEQVEQLLNEIEPEIHLQDSVAVLRALDAQYPPLGEFLDIPANAFKEFVVNRLVNMTQEICRERMRSKEPLWKIMRGKFKDLGSQMDYSQVSVEEKSLLTSLHLQTLLSKSASSMRDRRQILGSDQVYEILKEQNKQYPLDPRERGQIERMSKTSPNVPKEFLDILVGSNEQTREEIIDKIDHIK
jgi:hypothetical protein